MVYLENDAFLNELVRMFSQSKVKQSGTVYVTMKKFDGTKRASNPKPTAPAKGGGDKKKKAPKKEDASPDHACLVRAKLQNRKIATLVPAKEVNKFQLSYCSILRANMDALKKTKKNKSKSTKATS